MVLSILEDILKGALDGADAIIALLLFARKQSIR